MKTLLQHSTPEELAMALAGELPPERQEMFDQHRAACPRCAAAYTEQAEAQQTMAALGNEQSPRQSRKRARQ